MLPDQIEAMTVDQGAPDRLAVRTVRLGPATTGEITVRVAAVSLNRGQVKRALTVADAGTVSGGNSPASSRGPVECPALQLWVLASELVERVRIAMDRGARTRGGELDIETLLDAIAWDPATA